MPKFILPAIELPDVSGILDSLHQQIKALPDISKAYERHIAIAKHVPPEMREHLGDMPARLVVEFAENIERHRHTRHCQAMRTRAAYGGKTTQANGAQAARRRIKARWVAWYLALDITPAQAAAKSYKDIQRDYRNAGLSQAPTRESVHDNWYGRARPKKGHR